MSDAALNALDALLEDERAALIAGDLDRIADIADRKQTLVAGLNDSGAEGVALVPLQRKMQRNQVLLDGALDGIRSVAARLAVLRETGGTLETYDRNGRRQTWSGPRGDGVERRA